MVGWALLIGLGALSAVLGVLYALMEDDLKRLLAYSSVENIGVIALGVGAAFLFQSLQMLPAAAFALAAALFHAVNHAAFKGLLFMGAGAVLHATGTRNMDGSAASSSGCRGRPSSSSWGPWPSRGCRPSTASCRSGCSSRRCCPASACLAVVAVLMVLALGMLALTAGWPRPAS